MHLPTSAFRVLLAAAAALALAPPFANAGTIEIHSFFKGAAVAFSFKGVDEPFLADGFGSVAMSNAQGLGSLDAAGSFEAYCVEMLGDIFNPGSSTDPGPPLFPGPDFPPGRFVTIAADGQSMSGWFDPADGIAGAGPKAAWLYGAFNPSIESLAASTLITFTVPGGPITAPADVARTALASAIWEVLYENAAAYGVNDGNGRFSIYCDKTLAPLATCASRPQGSVVALANGMLASLGSSTAAGTWLKLGIEGDPVEDVQNFVGPAAGASAAPEPAITVLLAGSLAVWAARCVRRGTGYRSER